MALTRRRSAVAVAAAAAVGLVSAPGAAATGVERGPLVRVTNQDPGLCHSESEPAVAVTDAGTWVAFNDVGDCLPGALPGERRFLTVQLLRRDRPPQQFALPALPAGENYLGDPALAVDADGRGVVASSLVSQLGPQASGVLSSHRFRLGVMRLRPDGSSTALPSPSRGVSDDKELIAVDRSARSRFRGRVYVVWDELDQGHVTLRAFDGRAWSSPVAIDASGLGRHPDVAVGPDGQVAVVYSDGAGVAARTSTDGGTTFGPAFRVLAGAEPGRVSADCPLVNVVGVRQRVIMGPRVAIDGLGRLHVTAATGAGRLAPAAPGRSSARIRYAVATGRTVAEREVPSPEPGEQFASAVAVLPDGRAVVSHLAVDESGTSLTAWAVVFSASGRMLSRTPLSEAPSMLPSAAETASYTYCYGLGDYTSVTPHGRAVTAAWGSAEGVARPAGDTDVLLRTLRLP